MCGRGSQEHNKGESVMVKALCKRKRDAKNYAKKFGGQVRRHPEGWAVVDWTDPAQLAQDDQEWYKPSVADEDDA